MTSRLRQQYCAHRGTFTITENGDVGGVTITRTIERTCTECGRDLLKSPVRPRRLLVTILIGFLGSTFLVGLRSQVALDWLTVVLAVSGGYGAMLLHAWWLGRYQEAVERGDMNL